MALVRQIEGIEEGDTDFERADSSVTTPKGREHKNIPKSQ